MTSNTVADFVQQLIYHSSQLSSSVSFCIIDALELKTKQVHFLGYLAARNLHMIFFFFVPCIFIYLRPSTTLSVDKMVAVFYTVITPPTAQPCHLLPEKC